MAEEVWMLQTKKADFKQIGARFRIDPVTARIIRNRGIEGEAAIDRYLNGTLDDAQLAVSIDGTERLAGFTSYLVVRVTSQIML